MGVSEVLPLADNYDCTLSMLGRHSGRITSIPATLPTCRLDTELCRLCQQPSSLPLVWRCWGTYDRYNRFL